MPEDLDRRAQQSAEREDQMRDRFQLEPGNAGTARDAVDAVLRRADGTGVNFEVKSSDGKSVSTARDVGREHIVKWRKRHWLFGFYVRGSRNPPMARSYIYASPRQLEPWIAEQEEYVGFDWELVRRLPEMVGEPLLDLMFGHKDRYDLSEAKRLLKQQKLEAGEHITRGMDALLRGAGLRDVSKMTSSVYQALVDEPGGLSIASVDSLVLTLDEPITEQDAARLADAGDPCPLSVAEAILKGRRLQTGGRLTKRALAAAADIEDGFSRERMLVLFKERARYLLDRGSTRNNPHISEALLLKLVPDDQVLAGSNVRRGQWLEERVTRKLQRMAEATEDANA